MRHRRSFSLAGAGWLFVLLCVPAATEAQAVDRFDAALEAAAAIRSPAWRVIELAHLAEARQRVGDRSGAGATLDQAVRNLAETPAGTARVPALAAVARAQAALGRAGEAMKTAERLPAGTMERVETLGHAAAAQARAGDRKSAGATHATRLQDARRLSTPAEQSRALAAVAEAEAGLGLKERSEAHFREALAAARKAGVSHLLELARVQTRAGALQGATSTLLEARKAAESGHAFLLLPDIARLQFNAGASRAAAATLDAAHRLARETQDASQRSLLLYLVARGMADTGRYDRALHISRSLPDLGWRAAALQQVGAAQTGNGLRAEALKVLAEAGRLARAIPDRAEKQVTLTSRAVALRAVGETQLLAGQKGLASGSLDEAVRSARTIETPGWRAVELAKIAAVQARAGLRQEAAETLQAAEEALSGHGCAGEAPSDEGEPVLEIVRVRVFLREYDEALRTAEALRQRPETRDAALAQLAPVLLRERRYGDAERFAAAIRDDRLKARTLLAIAVARSEQEPVARAPTGE